MSLSTYQVLSPTTLVTNSDGSITLDYSPQLDSVITNLTAVVDAVEAIDLVDQDKDYEPLINLLQAELEKATGLQQAIADTAGNIKLEVDKFAPLMESIKLAVDMVPDAIASAKDDVIAALEADGDETRLEMVVQTDRKIAAITLVQSTVQNEFDETQALLQQQIDNQDALKNLASSIDDKMSTKRIRKKRLEKQIDVKEAGAKVTLGEGFICAEAYMVYSYGTEGLKNDKTVVYSSTMDGIVTEYRTGQGYEAPAFSVGTSMGDYSELVFDVPKQDAEFYVAVEYVGTATDILVETVIAEPAPEEPAEDPLP